MTGKKQSINIPLKLRPLSWYRGYLRDQAEKLDAQTKQKANLYFYIGLTLFTVSFFGFFAIKPTMETVSNLNKQYDSISQQIATLKSALKSANSRERKRNPNPEIKAELAKLAEEKVTIKAKRKEITESAKTQLSAGDAEYKVRVDQMCAASGKYGPRAVAEYKPIVLVQMLEEPQWSDFWKAVKKNEADKVSAQKQLRHESGLADGTYSLIEQAVNSATAKVKKSGAAIRWRKHTRYEGAVGVQFKDDTLTTSALFDNKSQFLQIDPLPEGQLDTRSGRRNAKTKVRIRVGSEGRKPIWCEFSVVLHRKVPDGIIKQASVQVFRIGNRKKYELQLTLRSNEFNKAAQTQAGVVAVDLGWRTIGSNIRVGYLFDSLGNHHELLLPAAIKHRLEKCSELASVQDVNFNVARQCLIQYMRENEVPGWVREETKYIGKWRSPAKLARVTAKWVSEIGCKDEMSRAMAKHSVHGLFENLDVATKFANQKSLLAPNIVVYLEAWRRQNRHLYQWTCDLRTRTLRYRRDIYRQIAATLGKYETLVLEEFDLSDLSQNKSAENNTTPMELEKAKHRNKNIVAPSEFREALMDMTGLNVVKVDARGTTAIHNVCGHYNNWSEKEKQEQFLKCEKCGEVFDRDRNGAQNILNRFYERRGDSKLAGSARISKLQENTPEIVQHAAAV